MNINLNIYECRCHRKCKSKHKKAQSLQLNISKDGKSLVRGQYIMVTLKDGQSVDFSLVALDSRGRPVRVDGVPVFENSNPAAADLFVAADGLSGKITHLDTGTVQIKATVDADLGEGVRELIALGDIECLSPEAATVALNFAAPTP